MDYDDIFEAYYNLYRAEATTPSSTDDEYTVGMRLANEAISRWENYDGTLWQQLYDTRVNNGTGGATIVYGDSTYATPTNFKKGGGKIRLVDSDGNTRFYISLVSVEEAQFKSDDAIYAYFTGYPGNYVLNINGITQSMDGLTIDYDYYKTATKFTTGTSTTEMSNPYFIIHRMLANRFRASRNPYYSSALRDGEDALKIMQLENNSGTWSNPWSLPDRSGASWGA